MIPLPPHRGDPPSPEPAPIVSAPAHSLETCTVAVHQILSHLACRAGQDEPLVWASCPPASGYRGTVAVSLDCHYPVRLDADAASDPPAAIRAAARSDRLPAFPGLSSWTFTTTASGHGHRVRVALAVGPEGSTFAAQPLHGPNAGHVFAGTGRVPHPTMHLRASHPVLWAALDELFLATWTGPSMSGGLS